MKILAIVVTVALPVLASCSDPEADARMKLEALRKANASPAQICHEALALRDTALSKGDDELVAELQTDVNTDCFASVNGYDNGIYDDNADNIDAASAD